MHGFFLVTRWNKISICGIVKPEKRPIMLIKKETQLNRHINDFENISYNSLNIATITYLDLITYMPIVLEIKNNMNNYII